MVSQARLATKKIDAAAGFASRQESVAPAPQDLLAELIRASAQGQHRAFAQLYRLTGARLLTLATRIVGQRSIGEEVVQEAFVRVWRYADRFDPSKGSGLSWLVTIVRNRAFTAKAALRTRSAESGEELPMDLAAADVDFFRDLASREESRRIRACLSRLSENHRRSILLVYFDGLTHGELAGRLNVPAGTAKSWVRRGLAQLGTCLRGDAARDWRDRVAAEYSLGNLQGPARRAFERKRDRDAAYCTPAVAWEIALSELVFDLEGMEAAARDVWDRLAYLLAE